MNVASVAAMLRSTGPALDELCARADEARRRQVGDVVTWVTNRNVNFTNVCVKSCRFCAYARGLRSEQGYLLPLDEILRRVDEAVGLGATEICVQAGLLPGATAETYLAPVRAIKAAFPAIHLHAWSPEEVQHGARAARRSLADWVAVLKDAGVGSLPGTSAEILDDRVRRRIAPGRISTQAWIEVITSAHRVGLPTTCTMMYGHVETAEDQAAHLLLLRRIQEETGGFTEFVPLSFVAAESPLHLKDPRGEVAAGPTWDAVRAVHATARLVLGDVLPHLQVSWVKEGPARASALLACGADDLGGTLVNESISTAAGSGHGQRLRPQDLVAIAAAAGRPAAERTTLYGRLPPRQHPLDEVAPDDPRFGSYAALAADPRWRFEPAAP